MMQRILKIEEKRWEVEEFPFGVLCSRPNGLVWPVWLAARGKGAAAAG